MLYEYRSERFAIVKSGRWDGMSDGRFIKYEASVRGVSNFLRKLIVKWLSGLVKTRSYADSVPLWMYTSREHFRVMIF